MSDVAGDRRAKSKGRKKKQNQFDQDDLEAMKNKFNKAKFLEKARVTANQNDNQNDNQNEIPENDDEDEMQMVSTKPKKRSKSKRKQRRRKKDNHSDSDEDQQPFDVREAMENGETLPQFHQRAKRIDSISSRVCCAFFYLNCISYRFLLYVVFL